MDTGDLQRTLSEITKGLKQETDVSLLKSLADADNVPLADGASSPDVFAELRSHKKGNKAKANAVVIALTSVLQSTHQPLIPAAYMGLLFQTLQQQASQPGSVASDENLEAMLLVFRIVIDHIAASSLRRWFPVIVPSMLRLIQSRFENNNIVRSALNSVGKLFLSQELGTEWSKRLQLMPTFQALLALSLDLRPKVRHEVIEVFGKLFRKTNEPDAEVYNNAVAHQISSSVKRFVEQQLTSDDSRKDPKTVSHLFNALEPLIGFLVPLKPLLTQLLRLIIQTMTELEASRKSGYALLSHLFSHRPTRLSPKVLVDELFQGTTIELLAPPLQQQDTYSITSFCEMLFHATILLLEMDRKEEFDPLILPKTIKSILNFFPSCNNSTLEPLSLAIEILIQNCVDEMMRVRLEQALSAGDVSATALDHILQSLKDCLGYQYQFSWGHILLLIAQTFLATGRACCDLPVTKSILATVEEIMKDAAQAEHRPQATRVIVGALKASGATKLLQILPLNLQLAPGHPQRREWLLPLLNQYTRGSSLPDFETLIMPDIQRILPLLARAPNQILPSLYKQLWSLFPAFCRDASGAGRGFKSLAKVLGLSLKDQPAVRSVIARGITSLIKQNQTVIVGDALLQLNKNNKSDVQVQEEDDFEDVRVKPSSSAEAGDETKKTAKNTINKVPLPQRKKQDVPPLHVINEEEAKHNIQSIAAFAKNFLPILFNCITAIETTGADNPIVRKDIFELIQSFLSISTADLLNSFFKSLLTKLAEASREQAVLDQTAAQSSKKTSSQQMTEEQMEDDQEQKKQQKLQRAKIAKSLVDYTELATLFVAHLDENNLHLVFNAVKTQLFHESPNVQKKSYKLIHTICVHHAKSFLKKNLEEFKYVVLHDMHAAKGAAKKGRLQCILALVENSKPKLVVSILDEILPQVILCLKETNTKAREEAFSTIEKIGDYLVANKCYSLDDFLQHKVVAGLAGKTPHMISATIVSMARLIFDFRTQIAPETVVQVTRMVSLLFQSSNREIIKSCLGFIRVAVQVLPHSYFWNSTDDEESADQYMEDQSKEDLYKVIVKGMLLWSDDRKSRFRLKSRVIFERLIRKVGYENVAQLMPENRRKIVSNIRKLRARKEKELALKRQQRDQPQSHSRGDKKAQPSNDASDDDLDDIDSDDELNFKYRKDKSAKTNKSFIVEKPQPVSRKRSRDAMEDDLDDDDDEYDGDDNSILDLLDSSSKNIVSKDPRTIEKQKEKQKERSRKLEKEFNMTADGKIVISKKQMRRDASKRGQDSDDDDDDRHDQDDFDSDDEVIHTNRKGTKSLSLKRGRERMMDELDELDDLRDDEMGDSRFPSSSSSSSSSSGAAEKKKNAYAPPLAKRRKIDEKEKAKAKAGSKFVHTGEKFQSQKATGDVKRGNIDPFAYLPLNPSLLNRRKNAKASQQFEKIAKAAKKGARSKSFDQKKKPRK